MAWSFSALPMRVARRVRRKLEYALLGRLGTTVIPVGRAHAGGVVDAVELGNDGTLAVVGWSPDADAYAGPMTLSVRDASMACSHVFRVTRPDLAKLAGVHPTRLGLVVEFVLPLAWSGATATLAINGAPLAEIDLASFTEPAYAQLYGNPGVWHREHIYNVGAPVRQVSSEILELCQGMNGPLLDFGCGAGILVQALRSRGLDARGLELDSPEMREAIEPGMAPYVTYYPGELPAPFDTGAFETVTCCEVLEHIPDYDEVVRELARLTRKHLLLTVPDMSAIPRGYRHGVVPWHLMERSHVNFFTQQTLHDTLRPHFRDVQFFRVGEVRCDRMRFYTSLLALCVQPQNPEGV